MPRPPASLGDDINMVTGFWANPCSVPIVVYFEILASAVGKVTLSLLLFGLDDVVRGFYRPERLRHWRHGRKGRKARVRRAFIPELGEVVAQVIPGVEAVQGRWIDDGTRWLWVLDGVTQRLIYYFMILDIINEFWYELNSSIITYTDAHCEGVARMLREGTPALTGPQGWIALDADVIRYNENMTSDDFGCIVPAGQFIAVVGSNIFNKQTIAEDLTCGVRVTAIHGTEGRTNESSIATIGIGQTHNAVASLNFHGPANVTWEGLKIGAEAEFRNLTVSVFQIGN